MRRLVILAVELTVGLLLGAAESLFWLMHFAYSGLLVAGDALRARAALPEGILRCPAGHAVPTEDETYECRACGYVYEGSVWVCANVECQAITPYTNCPTCGLSVRNPYRWGRP